MKIRYLAVAREEIREAADYYAAISPELGIGFKRELRQLMRLVATMPLAWPPSGPDSRKCLMTRFPYLVIYTVMPDGLLVLAVGHQHRRPGYWRERVAILK
ncbi:MAG: type II toxin-antitoxin system RelE/ParE family toxin [Rhodocyclaceae bacterium]|nr:type II toxin-antitoxin system RelE/ParE family toxin [Rhodocyclaceae bacterium]